MNFEQQFIIKPTFNIGAFLLKLAITLLSFVVAMGNPYTDYNNALLAISTLAFIIFSLDMLYTVLYYAKHKYVISDKGISVINDLPWCSSKDILYSEMREVQLKKTFLQKIFGLGSLHIPANLISFTTGITIVDIKNSDSICSEIQKRIEQADISEYVDEKINLMKMVLDGAR